MNCAFSNPDLSGSLSVVFSSMVCVAVSHSDWSLKLMTKLKKYFLLKFLNKNYIIRVWDVLCVNWKGRIHRQSHFWNFGGSDHSVAIHPDVHASPLCVDVPFKLLQLCLNKYIVGIFQNYEVYLMSWQLSFFCQTFSCSVFCVVVEWERHFYIIFALSTFT